jgi:ABC-type uncharacterized transport system substrate-binding protein
MCLRQSGQQQQYRLSLHQQGIRLATAWSKACHGLALSIELTETVGKRLELLRELVPALRRVAILFNGADPQVNMELKEVLAAARTLSLDVVRTEIRPDEDFTAVIAALKGRADALYVCLDPFVYSNAARINTLALAARLPVMEGVRQNAEAGGLVSYGPDFPDMSRRAAEIVNKILRGAKPAEIPVEQPTKFDLVINLKTWRHNPWNDAFPRRRGDRMRRRELLAVPRNGSTAPGF